MVTREVAPLTRHPAPFSAEIIDVARRLVRAEQRRLGRPIRVLDPFAGVGRVHQLRTALIETVGVELEAEWASCHIDTICADSLAWMRLHGGLRPAKPKTALTFDVIFTSPAYGNRFADHHDAKDGSTRRSYAHDLGRTPSPGSSCVMQWGREYWRFHADAYRAMLAVARAPRGDDPGTLLLLNVSDFVRHKARVPAVMWHRGACNGAGWVETERARLIDTKRMRYGENHDARVPTETILRMRPA